MLWRTSVDVPGSALLTALLPWRSLTWVGPSEASGLGLLSQLLLPASVEVADLEMLPRQLLPCTCSCGGHSGVTFLKHYRTNLRI